MINYRNLFEQEFGGDRRLFDIKGSGLPLGIKTLDMDDVFKVLNMPARSPAVPPAGRKKPEASEKLKSFIQAEKHRLVKLQSILTGETADEAGSVNILIEECDYLWAHFPDYSGGRRPDTTEIAQDSQTALSFLKRVRAEINPMIKLFERVIKDIK
jgi:hypothetical protein